MRYSPFFGMIATCLAALSRQSPEARKGRALARGVDGESACQAIMANAIMRHRRNAFIGCVRRQRYQTWRKRPCNPSTTRSARGCHPCLRYDPLPMSPGRARRRRDRLRGWGGRTRTGESVGIKIRAYCRRIRADLGETAQQRQFASELRHCQRAAATRILGGASRLRRRLCRCARGSARPRPKALAQALRGLLVAANQGSVIGAGIQQPFRMEPRLRRLRGRA